ncbi:MULTISPECIES: membrane-targeted effector domain-containing toxin [Pseudomonas]|uniref:membrane-targeted effector domain-containing toxin n=1 Tax=Pseudomonas TaxID=286 RepID=UPI00325FA4B9
MREKPCESLTLTQLVIHRFRATDQDNTDLLDLYAGFYTSGPQTEDFNETNEVRLHGNEVLKDFWSIDFSERYRHRLQTFWDASATDFRTLAKCNFLVKAIEARDARRLSDADFQTVVNAVIGPLTWPVSLSQLQAETPLDQHSKVYALDVAGHVANNILRIIDSTGRQILYLPGDVEAFVVCATPSDMHWWILQQMNQAHPRQLFLNHFALIERQAISENISDLMNRLVSSWGRADHHLINQHEQAITGDAFTWLRDSTRTAMFAEAGAALTSNADLRKKLWVGYLSAGLKLFGPMAVVGWPVALPVIGASLASLGLNIDQAVNGKTAAERKEGVIGAVLSGIDLLFNLPFLKGVGSIAEISAQAEAAEWAEYAEGAQTPDEPAFVAEEPDGPFPPATDTPPMPAPPVQPSVIPQAYQCNELLDGLTPATEAGKFQGVYRLDSDPPYAILLNDTPYYVHYFADARGSGFWAIVDPAKPNQFIHALPVRLTAAGTWERLPRLGLKAGGQCLGKQCAPAFELDTFEPDTADAPAVAPPVDEPQPSTSTGIGLVRTPYDVDPAQQATLKKWALRLPQTHLRFVIGPEGDLIAPDHYPEHFAEKFRHLVSSAKRFYANLHWNTLPPRPALPAIEPSTTIEAFISRALELSPGLVIAETPGRITSMRLLIEHMPTFARAGTRTLYVHRLLSDFAQLDLNQYFHTGSMPRDLEMYLSRMGGDPLGRFNELELVKTAQQHGVRVQAIDCTALYRRPLTLPQPEQQIVANHLIHDIMLIDRSMNDTGKWVVLTDTGNINTFRGLPGLAELEGGIGLRIEEVDPGQGQRFSADPGIDIQRGPVANAPETAETVDTFHADLLLQMEAPPVTRNPLQTSRLLQRPGMYVFERTEQGYTLVHRSTTEQIVRTPVQRTAAGYYFIERPTWARVNQVPYANLERMSRALAQEYGLSLQSQIPA